MPGRHREPSFRLASGTTNERDNSYNISNTPGSIFYNTDTSNVEFSDNVDISGTITCETAPSGGSDLCNKTYVDGLHKTGFGANFANYTVISYSVFAGNPTSSSGGDNLNGRMDTPASGLNADVTIPVVTGAIGETGNVKVDFCVVGEWSDVEWDKGLFLARAEQQSDGDFSYNYLMLFLHYGQRVDALNHELKQSPQQDLHGNLKCELFPLKSERPPMNE